MQFDKEEYKKLFDECKQDKRIRESKEIFKIKLLASYGLKSRRNAGYSIVAYALNPICLL